MDDKKAWLAPLGVCIVCLFLAGALQSAPKIAAVLIVLAAGAAVGAGVVGARGIMGGKIRLRKDPYDLKVLREVDERMLIDSLDPGHVSEQADQVVCIRCGTTYRTRLPVCPNCRHMQ
jgi:hypothetical protein